MTASEALKEPMGVMKKKVVFTLSSGTPHECKVSFLVTVANTTTYDTLLSVEFMVALGGCFVAFPEMFKYGWVSPDRRSHNYEISAPCHLTSPPLIAYSLFGSLINHEAELYDGKGADVDIICAKDDYGYHGITVMSVLRGIMGSSWLTYFIIS